MRMKLIVSVFAAGALLGAAQAEATVCVANMSLSTWAGMAGGCTDSDGDTTYILKSQSLNWNNTSASVNIGETSDELNSVTVGGFNGPGGELPQNALPYTLNYTVDHFNGSELFYGAQADTLATGGVATLKKTIDFPLGGTSVTMTSTGGIPSPYTSFDPTQLLDVTDIVNTNGSSLLGFQNTYSDVPEPGSMLLLGIGLMGLAYNGKKKLIQSV